MIQKYNSYYFIKQKFMNMQQIIRSLVGLTMAFLPFITVAQPGAGPDPERMEAYRVAYFTKMLELSAEEAEVFWPVFNDFVEKRRALKDSLAMDGKLQLMADAEVEAYLRKSLDIEQAILDEKHKMIKQLSEVLPIRKVAMLNQVEMRFKEELLNRLRSRRRPEGK
jgi:hypothetical protein